MNEDLGGMKLTEAVGVLAADGWRVAPHSHTGFDGETRSGWTLRNPDEVFQQFDNGVMLAPTKRAAVAEGLRRREIERWDFGDSVRKS